MFNKISNISLLTLYWQHQAWFLLSSCAFQEEAGAARPGCCGGMPRALLHSHPSGSTSPAAWLLFQVHLGCSVPFFHTAVHQVGSPCPVKVGSHPGASTASSTWDCCWNWEGSLMGPRLGTSRRFGVGSWAGLVAFCWGITISLEGIQSLSGTERKKSHFQHGPAPVHVGEVQRAHPCGFGCRAGGSLSRDHQLLAACRAFFPCAKGKKKKSFQLF